MEQFGDLFANEPQRRHFAEYLTGLMLRQRKSVLGINRRVCPDHRPILPEQFLDRGGLGRRSPQPTAVGMAAARIPVHNIRDRGVIAIDNVLIDHDGKFIKDVGWFWDHAEQTQQDRPRLSVRQLRLHQRQALSLGVPPLQQAGAMRGHRRERFQPHQSLSASWSIGSASGKFPAISPSTAISPTPRSSTTSTPNRTVSAGRGATWAT